MKRAGLALLALLALLLAACGGGEEASTVSPAGSPVASPTLSPVPAPAAPSPVGSPTAATGVDVSFVTEDNVTIEGRLFRSGETAVVFAHMYPNDQRAWWDFAREVAADGYAALTFDFRGYGETGGSRDIALIDRDLAAAVRYLREQGYQRVVLVGASMGGTAALKVAARDEFDGLVAGVVAVSAPESFQGLVASDDVGNIKVPIIFVASEGDGSAVDSLGSLYEKASGSRERQRYVYTGDAHGTDLLQSDHAEEFKSLLLDFFATVSLQ
jgi:pimeloyl-ACP methyl ester carboxylesterase